MILSLIEPSLPSELQRLSSTTQPFHKVTCLFTEEHSARITQPQTPILNWMHRFQVPCFFLSLLKLSLVWLKFKTKALFSFFHPFQSLSQPTMGHLRANKVFSVQFMQQETSHKLSFIKPINCVSVWIWDVLESAEKTPIPVTNHTFRPPAAHFHYSFLIIRSNWVRETLWEQEIHPRLDSNVLVLSISISSLLGERPIPNHLQHTASVFTCKEITKPECMLSKGHPGRASVLKSMH